MRNYLLVSVSLLLAGCAGAQATRTSANTMIINARAAPACGAAGAARVASKSAAIETIRAGYERYIIVDAASQNNVRVTQLPGTVNTTGTITYGNGFGTVNTTSRYTPGPTIISGGHKQSLAVVMFRSGDPGYERALDARQMLGPNWEKLVKSGIRTCTN